jgi:septal ring factor EnvC (AmiA/AmiB activator)
LCISISLYGQSRQELEEKRKALLEEIEQTEQDLASTQKDRKLALSRYINLQNQVKNRESLISTLRTETSLLEESIERTSRTVEALQHDIIDLKEEYAQTIRTAYRLRLNRSLLIFLFSTNSFNQAVQRWQYIRQYEKYRSRQAELIEITQETLSNKLRTLADRKEEKETLLAVQEQQRKKLSGELGERNQILKGLRQDEKKLADQLEEKREAERKLKETIASVIRKEMNAEPAATRPARRAEEVRLSENFADNRGALPWPVARGEVSKSYGTQQHPKFKGVKTTNNGIDIRTEPGAEVYAVFTGRVVSSSYIPGYQNTIILRHGEFYSVYSNLAGVMVERGQEVKGGDLIGRVSRQEPEVHFELWKEKNSMNPGKWIQAR